MRPGGGGPAAQVRAPQGRGRYPDHDNFDLLRVSQYVDNAQSQIKLLEFAAEALQDDFIGFHLAQDYDLREIGFLYYVLASSEILADALHRAER